MTRLCSNVVMETTSQSGQGDFSCAKMRTTQGTKGGNGQYAKSTRKQNKEAETPLASDGASFMLYCYYESWAISLSVINGAVIWSEEPEMRDGSIRSPEAGCVLLVLVTRDQQRSRESMQMQSPAMTWHILQHTGVVLLDIYSSPT